MQLPQNSAWINWYLCRHNVVLWKVPSGKNEQDMGMSEYQVRGRRAWYHHIARCIMAQGYVLEEKLLAKDDYPLLSAYDVSQVII
jgi:hypothetical protein